MAQETRGRHSDIVYGEYRTPRIPLYVVISLVFVVRSICLLRRGSVWAIAIDSDRYLALARGLEYNCGFAPWNGGCGMPEITRIPGYPVFLVPFWGHIRTVVLAQALIGT
jgi:hypothetical protein